MLDISKEQALNPFSWYRHMRESQPVFYHQRSSTWLVFRYDESEQMLTDYKLFSSIRNKQVSEARPSILNPHIAEAMKNLGYVQRFGLGIELARKELARNGNPPPEFKVEDTYIHVTLRSKI